MTAIEYVPPERWRHTCLAAGAQGLTFEGLFAAPLGGELRLRAVFHAPDATRVLVSRPAAGTVETLVDAFPAAAWDERSIADLHGVRFDGHEPLRPLLDHGAALAAWTVPVTGDDVHQLAVGPIHAGVIESGHFRFHVVGERILHLDTRLFYKRRGLERAAVGRPLDHGLAYAVRACAACSVTNGVAYAQAHESAAGLAPDAATRRGRTLLLELERVYNHLGDVAQICAGVSFAAGTVAFAALKERAQRLNAGLTGHRFLFGAVTLGGSGVQLDASAARTLRAQLRTLDAEHRTLWRELRLNRSLADRLDDVGVLSREDAARLGAVGPAARASGVAFDQRADSPLLAYPGFAPAVPFAPAAPFAPSVPRAPGGDVASRLAQRPLELEQSFAVLDEILSAPIPRGGVTATGGGAPAGSLGGPLGVARVESPRGRTVLLLESQRGAVRALHLRTGSYANWQVMAATVPGNLLPDFPLINKSFELCYACADR